MTNRPTITDEELDLLAEGELSHAERADLFRRLDENPSHWKDCALAILEAQSLRKSLRQSLADQPMAQALPGGTTRRSARSQRIMHFGTAVAVVLVLAAGTLAGYWMGHSSGSAVLPGQLASETMPPTSARPEPADEALPIAVRSTLSWLNVPDEKLLALVRIEDGEGARIVPIVASPTLADQLRLIPPVALRPEQIRQANQHGWNIIQHPQFIAIEGPAEKSKVVAVQMVRYKFAGSEAI
jgi:anti-sigma factor RsiW